MKIDWRRGLIVILSLLAGELFFKIFDFKWWQVVLFLLMWFLFLKLPKKFSWIFLVVLFFLVLSINKLFGFRLNPLSYTFDFEKIVWSSPVYLRLMDSYKSYGLWLPFRIRNLFYAPWWLIFNWINLVFKLFSWELLMRMLGYSGLFLTILGVINFFSHSSGISLRSKKIWQPLFWWLTVVMAAGCGILVDSKNALVLALPAIIYFMFLGTKKGLLKHYKKIWFLLLIIDLLIK